MAQPDSEGGPPLVGVEVTVVRGEQSPGSVLAQSVTTVPTVCNIQPGVSEARDQDDCRDERKGDEGEGGGGGDQARVPPPPAGAVRPQQCENQGGGRTGGQRLSRLWSDHTRPVAS